MTATDIASIARSARCSRHTVRAVLRAAEARENRVKTRKRAFYDSPDGRKMLAGASAAFGGH